MELAEAWRKLIEYVKTVEPEGGHVTVATAHYFRSVSDYEHMPEDIGTWLEAVEKVDY